MIESRDIPGYWWLPDNPDQRVPGNLLYSPLEGLTLSLNGAFHEENKYRDPEYYHNFILGFSQNGKNITLQGCFLKSGTQSFPGYPQSSYVIKVAFLGIHITNERDVKFKEYIFRLGALEEWLGIRPFKDKSEHVDEKSIYTISYELPEPIIIELDNFKMEINYGYTMGLGDEWREKRIETYASICIKYDTDVPLDEVFNVINLTRNFISLGVGERIGIIQFEARFSEFGKKEDVELLYRTSVYQDELDSIRFWRMVFRYNNISDNPKLYLKNWFDKSATLGPVYDLFFATFYIPNIYSLHEFPSLAQALEAYHSRTFNNEVLQQVEFTTLKHNIIKEIKQIPEEYQSHFYSKVRYMNKKNLRDKLDELFSKYSFIVNQVVNDVHQFREEIADTRNYYTHYDEKIKDKATDIKFLSILAQKIRFILLGILLYEIGFEKDLILTGIEVYKSKWEITRVT